MGDVDTYERDDEFGYDYYEEKDLVILAQPGPAKFLIVEAVKGVSKTSGMAMLTITTEVTDPNGTKVLCRDYLVRGRDDVGKKRLATKIRNIANAINKPELYATGYKIKPIDLEGEMGDCEVKTQTSEDDYPDKTVITKWISKIPKKALASADANIEDDLAF